MRGTHIIGGTVAGVFGLAAATMGCSGQRAALQTEVGGLQDQTVMLENTVDRLEERVAALELLGSQEGIRVEEKVPAEKIGEAGAGADRPALRVVKLGPPAPDEPAPLIKPEPDREADHPERNHPERDHPERDHPERDHPEREEPRPLIHGSGERLETRLPEENGPTSLSTPVGPGSCTSQTAPSGISHTDGTAPVRQSPGART